MSGRSRFAAGALCRSAAVAFALLAVSVLPGRAQDLQYVPPATIPVNKIGTTNISVFNSSNQLIKVVEVQVSLDLGSLASKIRALTRDPGIRVSSENGQVVLSGVARNAANADEAFNLAKSWAPK